MVFDQATRNRLQRFVNDARKVLEAEFNRQMQNEYGLDPVSGIVTPLEKLVHLTETKKETARILRDILAHYLLSEKVPDTKVSLERIVREQAFTVLNRIVALRMAETRGLIIESIEYGYQAKGFQLYARVMGNSLGKTGETYRTYLYSVFDELSQDLPGLFDRYSPQCRLFPRETALLQLIELVNQSETSILWAEDETIGWIFQYFNSKEERKQMRDASAAPRNSRELAVRNQFFTPRYVVEFLVDNTLGRFWFNETGGKTSLKNLCQYLLVKPDEEIKLTNNLKDPRTLKLLDPACGSMHFGLYAFDLFIEIYREAWMWEQQNGPGSLDVSLNTDVELLPLCYTYSDVNTFMLDVPRLIITRNIFGVDIDARAVQIASLALWLRAQRSWHESGVRAKDRPTVGRGNVVAAISPPKEIEILEQIKTDLDKKDAELLDKTLQMLKNLPELGILLRVEQELPALIRQIYGEIGGLFKESDEETWQNAEVRLRAAIEKYAQAAKSTYQSRLFAQDAIELLRMIDLIREKYDVVVMNPPFGEIAQESVQYINEAFPNNTNNLICAFIERCRMILSIHGLCGTVVDKTVLIKNSYQKFRSKLLLNPKTLNIVTDLGWGVLDANVEVSTLVFWGNTYDNEEVLGVDISKEANKECALRNKIDSFINISHEALLSQPFSAINFHIPQYFQKALRTETSLCNSGYCFYNGHTIKSDVFKRLYWEISPDKINDRILRMWNGSSYSPYYVPFQECVIYKGYAGGLVNHNSTILRNLSKNLQAGLCYGKRGDYLDVQILPAGFILTNEGFGGPAPSTDLTWYILGMLNSLAYQTAINSFCGQHKGVGYVNILPLAGINRKEYFEISLLSKKTYNMMRSISQALETDPNFICPPITESKNEWIKEYKSIGEKVKKNLDAIDDLIFDVLDVNEKERNSVIKSAKNRPLVFPILSLDYRSNEEMALFWGRSIISYAIGCIFGRWDVRKIFTHPKYEFTSNPFQELPLHQPGMLNPDNSISADQHEPANYPIKIAKHGILVEDALQNEDIVDAIRCVLKLIWGVKVSTIEEEICYILKLNDLRHYIRSSNQFFAGHLQLYSKSNRQAPIYWPISTSSNSYTIWLYYPLLTNQTLFKALNDFLEPKIKQVSLELADLCDHGTKRSLVEENRFEHLRAFELELIELREKLLKIAQLYHPNQDDGVEITAAPLWSLFQYKPWQKALKETWEKLEKGDYDWAHLAMNYWPDRVREKCKTDKSLAIAHGLEELYMEPAANHKKKTKR